MIPILNSLPQKTVCHGKINDVDFVLNGGGNGFPFDGVVKTNLESKVDINFPLALLSPVLIMGYPTYSTYHVGAFDLFKLSDGYAYERNFNFEDGQKMKTQHNVVYHGDHLSGDFCVEPCCLKLPELRSGDLTVETFYPISEGILGSHFMMAWHTNDGKLYRASVESKYKLTHNLTLPYQQFRFIRFETRVTSSSIEQIERLNVIRELNKVNLSLVEKTYLLDII